jgi:formylglycine-generating enzyme required for sulfatase activity
MSHQTGRTLLNRHPVVWGLFGLAAALFLAAAGVGLFVAGRGGEQARDEPEVARVTQTRHARATKVAAGLATATALAGDGDMTPTVETAAAVPETDAVVRVIIQEDTATPAPTPAETPTPIPSTATPIPPPTETDTPKDTPTTSPPTPTTVPEPTAAPSPANPGLGTQRMRTADGAVMLYVPEGEFTMGSPGNEGEVPELPQHSVYLDAFWIDRTEVTNAQFAAFVEATGHETEAERNGGGDVFVSDWWQFVQGADWQHPKGPDSGIRDKMDYPVVLVSWNDARAYCEWAGARLPTEAEWEKGARGTDGRSYPWGNAGATCSYAVMGGESGNGCGQRDSAWPVGSKPQGASPCGALDMAGNVWEWVADRYAPDYYVVSPSSNPKGPSGGEERVRRGGSWYNSAPIVRVAVRNHNSPNLATDDITAAVRHG